MRTTDFFLPAEPSTDLFALPGAQRVDADMLAELRRRPLADKADVEVAVALARLVHDELQKYGTGGGQQLTNDEIREAILALRSVLRRLDVQDFNLPFRDYESFYGWWMKNGGYGSYQARRDLLAGLFDTLHDRLWLMEDEALTSSLADPISPHARTGWVAVDTEIAELRRHFQSARTPQDYRGVGLDCVAVTEALSATVYDPAKHLRDGETEPEVTKTKLRIERYVEDAAPGSENAALRKLARSAIEFAQDVKHRNTPNRRQAGIAADAVILLANVLRRLAEPQ